MKFNINDKVKVRITDKGHEILRDAHEKLQGDIPQIGDYDPPEVDDNGWTEFQMWGLMESFGSSISIGFDLPFEPEIEIPGEGWQPITKAQKDGSMILAGQWNFRRWWWYKTYYSHAADEWMLSESVDFNPTHYLPIEPPPESS